MSDKVSGLDNQTHWRSEVTRSGAAAFVRAHRLERGIDPVVYERLLDVQELQSDAVDTRVRPAGTCSASTTQSGSVGLMLLPV